MAAEQITQRLTPLPEAPDRKAPADFADKSDAFVAAQVGMVEEVNQMADEINAVAEAVNADAERADTAKGYAEDALAAKDAAESAKAAAEGSANSTASDRTAVSADRAQVQQIADTFTDLDAALASATNDADRAELAATAAQSVVTQDLSAIAAEISGTAVDVFIYDTTKDSDGGAWRKRCQHTSWYNEPLNTATRGARREFPAVAVIVAEADKVTIYDGDDPALPMWMVFRVFVSYTAGLLTVGNDGSVTAVSALNGSLVVTTKNTSNNQGLNGVFTISFPADQGVKYCQSQLSTYFDLSLEHRNAASGGGNNYLIGVGLVRTPSNFHNDVAMAVLPDAPINPATGLPVPTIAVATGAGVFVMKHDGSVVTKAYGLAACRAVDFDGAAVLVCGVGPDSYHNQWTWDLDSGTVREYGGYAISVPHLLGNIQDTKVKRTGLHRSAWHSASKLALLVENREDQSRGMVAYTAADYATGWMVGDTKGAFLASTDATPLSGSAELVTNGDFATGDLTGWTGTAGASVNASGQLEVATNGDGVDHSVTQANIPLVVGETYVVSFEIAAGSDSGSGKSLVAIGDSANQNRYFYAYITGEGAHSWVVKAANDNLKINLKNAFNGVSTVVWDNVSVKKAEADRSAYGNGLIVNGTLTRNPVADGAELVAYSGFSADNYLDQPYSSDLDFGTGDFCVMGWAKGQRSTQCIFDRGEGTSGLALEIYNGGLLVKTGGSYIIPTLSVNLTDGNWNSVAVVRRSGVLSLYANGVEVYSAANSKDVSVASASRVGVRLDGSRHANDLALVRISATAPTANQIRKIYEDERELFKAGAACTLHGSDSVVKALAYDDATDLLHVGTSEGRSVFKGLRRIDQTDTPVTTAIAASGGLIVEA